MYGRRFIISFIDSLAGILRRKWSIKDVINLQIPNVRAHEAGTFKQVNQLKSLWLHITILLKISREILVLLCNKRLRHLRCSGKFVERKLFLVTSKSQHEKNLKVITTKKSHDYRSLLPLLSREKIYFRSELLKLTIEIMIIKMRKKK